MTKRRFILLTVLIVITITGCSDITKAITTTISGNVSNDGEAISGAYVLLLEAEDELTEGISLSNGMITNFNGNYTMVAVSAGDYYIVAIDDVNNNIFFDIDTDRIGYYGVADTLLGITIPQTIHINKDDDLEDIDITDLYQLQ